jgi:mycoredoxin
MTTAATEVRFYWRPGCVFCANLRRQLERARVTYRAINIWDDPQAATTVRSVAGGNETVPTVIIGSRALVNPSLKAVLNAVRTETPGGDDTFDDSASPSGLLASILGKLRGDSR